MRSPLLSAFEHLCIRQRLPGMPMALPLGELASLCDACEGYFSSSRRAFQSGRIFSTSAQNFGL